MVSHNPSAPRIIPSRFDCKAGDNVNNRYRIESILGEGSFGCVYKVTDASGHLWALKVLRLYDVPSELRQPLIDRFEMEFKTGRIPSPNLVHSVDYGYLNGNPYIVMEFCSGGDLTKKIGNRDTDMVKYAKHILSGLRDLHRAGKVHRDLKPENVLLKDNDTAVLTDFGISGDRNKRMTERNIFGKPYQIFGTYAYMPPEQVNRSRGESTVLPTTDIFSFGVVLYQLLTGYLPFGVLNDQNDLVRYQKRGKAGEWDRSRLQNVPNGHRWMTLMEGCLQPEYKKRLQTIDAVLDLLPYDLAKTSTPMTRTPIPAITHAKAPSGYRLKVAQGLEHGKEYDLTKIIESTNRKVLTVGRDESCLISLADYADSHTSRRHFTIEYGGGDNWKVRDGQWIMEERCWKESSNGTYVNSTEATMAGIKVNNGDIITAGDIKLVFEIY